MIIFNVVLAVILVCLVVVDPLDPTERKIEKVLREHLDEQEG